MTIGDYVWQFTADANQEIQDGTDAYATVHECFTATATEMLLTIWSGDLSSNGQDCNDVDDISVYSAPGGPPAPTLHLVQTLALRVQASGRTWSESAGLVAALEVQVRSECRHLAALEVRVQG